MIISYCSNLVTLTESATTYRARSAVKEHTLWWLNANRLKDLFVGDRQNNSLLHLTKLLGESTDIRVSLLRLLVDLHGLDTGVILGRQLVEDEVAIFVDTDEVTRLQVLRVDEANNGKKNGLNKRRCQKASGGKEKRRTKRNDEKRTCRVEVLTTTHCLRFMSRSTLAPSSSAASASSSKI